MGLRIVGEDGTDVAPGESGEIWIRGPSVFLGYDENDAGHARSLRGRLVQERGHRHFADAATT